MISLFHSACSQCRVITKMDGFRTNALDTNGAYDGCWYQATPDEFVANSFQCQGAARNTAANTHLDNSCTTSMFGYIAHKDNMPTQNILTASQWQIGRDHLDVPELHRLRQYWKTSSPTTLH